VEPTVLVYSSHNRCNTIHNDWIVQRALRGNKQILFLPMSNGPADGDEYRRQVFSWADFSWFFNFYRQYDLNAFPFYWSSRLTREDVGLLLESVRACEVVIVGGGNPSTGMQRYRDVGRRFYREADLFERLLHERQARGLLTVGFSAGVDQLCQFMSANLESGEPDVHGFALCRNIIAGSHFEHGREGALFAMARRFGHCLVFGLPNDSGLAFNQGELASGALWQLIRFIVDTTWSVPEHQWHIKTRHGVKIQHMYSDGRHWAFNDGDALLRIQAPDGSRQEAFLILPGGSILDYWTQGVTPYASIGDILAAR
jgi:hypothetical protein